MRRRDFVRTLGWTGGVLAGGALALGRAARADAPPLRIDAARLDGWLAAMGAFGRNAEGGVSRTAYSDADRAGRQYVRQLMTAAGLDVRGDAAGNILGRRAGRENGLPPILFGSHVDSVPAGGNYDGPLGTLAAVEVARTLGDRGVVTRHPLEVVAWQNEEGGLVGSRIASGEFPARELDRVAASGKAIRDGITFLGGDPAALASAQRRRGDVAAYLELHVEQGDTLERARVDIGVVEGIVGIWQWTVTVDGFANHAGTTPMDRRQDALLSAARFIEMVNRVVRSEPGRQVGTVGQIRAEPGAPNVIPGRVVMSLELRDLDAAKVARLYGRIADESRAIGRDGGTTVAFAPITEHAPAPTDPRMRAIIADAARGLGLSTRALPSGAGHDAQEMARIAPTGMIFVPSVGGISHSPKEFTRPRDCANGANVLLQAVIAVDGRTFT
ncbi:Zn-dependent hydrolase [Gemmatimonadetes bacterium T265]|nr:Zn-dependent hydrolase [Gemmatimonadetes bacterium T265]